MPTTAGADPAPEPATDNLAPETNSSDRQPGRPMRADARRNYDKIVAAAGQVFGKRGAEASMDEVAKTAGVGPGTLYRHFPTRDALIDALMVNWVQQVRADCARVIDNASSAREKLETWFERFIANTGIYKGAAAKLANAMDDPSSPLYGKCQVLVDANDHVLDAVRASGAVREGVDNRDVLRLASGVAEVADRANFGDKEIRSMMMIVIDGVLRD